MRALYLNFVKTLTKYLIVSLLLLTIACNNNSLLTQYKTQHAQDSVLIKQTQEDDSAIKGYVSSFNKIQENLEQIKTREKIISLNGENKTNYDPIVDIKAIDNLIIRNHLELNDLQGRIKKDSQLIGFQAIVTHLKHELKEQETEINVLQNKLAKVSSAYQEITKQFNDSMAVIQDQNKTIVSLTKDINTVYYIIGTIKLLKEKNIITSNGGFIGIGTNTELKADINNTTFNKADLTNLTSIPLGAKFKKFISVHSPASYRITGNENMDTLHIINKVSFWKESKYLVIAVK